MTEKELLSKVLNFKDKNLVWSFDLYSPLFKKNIPYNIYFSNGKIELFEITLNTIEDFLNLEDTELKRIENCVWEHCLACNQDEKISSDGGKTWMEFSKEEKLKEYNIQSKNDIEGKWYVNEIFIDNEWGVENRIFNINILTEWDNEHFFSLIYSNGIFSEIEM